MGYILDKSILDTTGIVPVTSAQTTKSEKVRNTKAGSPS